MFVKSLDFQSLMMGLKSGHAVDRLYNVQPMFILGEYSHNLFNERHMNVWLKFCTQLITVSAHGQILCIVLKSGPWDLKSVSKVEVLLDSNESASDWRKRTFQKADMWLWSNQNWSTARVLQTHKSKHVSLAVCKRHMVVRRASTFRWYVRTFGGTRSVYLQ